MKQFTPAEWRTLQFAPFWVFSTLVGAYRNFDPLDIAALSDSLDIAADASGQLAQDVIASVRANRDSLLERYEQDPQNIVGGLCAVSDLLARTSGDEARMFRQMLVGTVGRSIATARGPFGRATTAEDEETLTLVYQLLVRRRTSRVGTWPHPEAARFLGTHAHLDDARASRISGIRHVRGRTGLRDEPRGRDRGVRDRVLPPAVPDRKVVSDFQTRPTSAADLHQRDSIDAHLTVVFAALAVSRWIETQTGWSIKKFVRTARRYRTIEIQAGSQTITAADPLPDDLHEALRSVHDDEAGAQ